VDASTISRAVAAGVSTAQASGLTVNDAVVLHDSNRVAVRLLPCDVLARIAYGSDQPSAEFEIEVAQRLTQAGSPVATLEPRVEPRVQVFDGFVVTLWSYYESLPSDNLVPSVYARALMHLHDGMRRIEVAAAHVTERVAKARWLLGDRARTPELVDTDRRLLLDTLRSLTRSIANRKANEQLLHGEPHPGNLLNTKAGPLFVDLETCCRGPVEFDIAHAPDKVADYYPAIDRDLLQMCRLLVLAMVTSWRWDRDDQLPDGRQRATEWLSQLRAGLDECGLDVTR